MTVGDNQGRSKGEDKPETHTSRPKENSGDGAGQQQTTAGAKEKTIEDVKEQTKQQVSDIVDKQS